MKHQMQFSDIGKYIFQVAGDIVHIGYSNMPAADQLKEKNKLSEVSNFHLKLLTFYIAGVAQRVYMA